jgi:hypothetical protein
MELRCAVSPFRANESVKRVRRVLILKLGASASDWLAMTSNRRGVVCYSTVSEGNPTNTTGYLKWLSIKGMWDGAALS